MKGLPCCHAGRGGANACALAAPTTTTDAGTGPRVDQRTVGTRSSRRTGGVAPASPGAPRGQKHAAARVLGRFVMTASRVLRATSRARETLQQGGNHGPRRVRAAATALREMPARRAACTRLSAVRPTPRGAARTLLRMPANVWAWVSTMKTRVSCLERTTNLLMRSSTVHKRTRCPC